MLGSDQNSKLNENYCSNLQQHQHPITRYPMVAVQQSALESPNSTPVENDSLTKGPTLSEQSLIKSFNELSCHCSACCHCHHGNIPSKACTYHQQSLNLWRGPADAAAPHQEQNEVVHVDTGHSSDGGSGSNVLENCPLVSPHGLGKEQFMVDDQEKVVIPLPNSSSNNSIIDTIQDGQSAANSQNPHLPLCIYTRGKLNNCVTKEKTNNDVKPSCKHGVSPKKFRKCSEVSFKFLFVL